MTSFDLVAWLSTLLDVLAAALALFGWPGRWDAKPPTHGRVGLLRVMLAGALGATTFLFKLPLLAQTARLNPFGIIRLAYLDLVVAAPALGLVLLWAGRRGGPVRLTWPARLAALGACLLAPIGVYATWVEPFRLQVERAAVPLSPRRAGSSPFRVGVLADLQTDHVTDYERGAVDRLMALEPDLVLVAGDIFQGDATAFQRELPALRELIGRLSAPGGVFVVPGDVDRGDDLERILAGSATRLLVNEVARTTVRDRPVTIGGVELDYASPAARELLRRLETAPDEDDVRILLSHRPDAALALGPRTRVDLAVAGHTHGGQVALPLLGPPMTLSAVPRRVGAGGLHDLGDGRRIYVSRGVGVERDQAPRIRFLVPPEVALLTLGN